MGLISRVSSRTYRFSLKMPESTTFLGMNKSTRNFLALWFLTGTGLVFYYDSFKDSSPHQQFYPAMIMMTKNTTVMGLTFVNWLSFVFLFTKILIKIFFGDLRAIEVENVISNFWITLTDIALTAVTFSRETDSQPINFILL